MVTFWLYSSEIQGKRYVVVLVTKYWASLCDYLEKYCQMMLQLEFSFEKVDAWSHEVKSKMLYLSVSTSTKCASRHLASGHFIWKVYCHGRLRDSVKVKARVTVGVKMKLKSVGGGDVNSGVSCYCWDRARLSSCPVYVGTVLKLEATLLDYF